MQGLQIQNRSSNEGGQPVLVSTNGGGNKKRIQISLKDLTRFERILWCFSLQRNLRKLFSNNKYDPEDKEFEAINCFKVLCIMCVVMGNTYYYILSGPL